MKFLEKYRLRIVIVFFFIIFYYLNKSTGLLTLFECLVVSLLTGILFGVLSIYEKLIGGK